MQNLYCEFAGNLLEGLYTIRQMLIFKSKEKIEQSFISICILYIKFMLPRAGVEPAWRKPPRDFRTRYEISRALRASSNPFYLCWNPNTWVPAYNMPG